MGTVVLLRHGQSEWNLANRFTGWWDVDLSEAGEAEARAAGRRLGTAGVDVDVAFTSVLTRAIRSCDLALHQIGRSWVPVERHWRLNERHYGGLTGLDKAETEARHGPEKYLAWRRSYATPPPPLERGSGYDVRSDPRYAAWGGEVVPDTECLADVVARMLPYWTDRIVPAVRAGRVALVVAHGNSLRALVKHLQGISDEAITSVEIPTGVPIVYTLDDDLAVVDQRVLDQD